MTKRDNSTEKIKQNKSIEMWRKTKQTVPDFSGKYHGKLNDKLSQLMWITKKLTRWNDPLFLLTGGAEAVESVSRIKVPLQLVRLAWLPKYSRKNKQENKH